MKYSKESAAHDIGVIEGKIEMYNQVMDIITNMLIYNDQRAQGFYYSKRTLDALIEKIITEVEI